MHKPSGDHEVANIYTKPPGHELVHISLGAIDGILVFLFDKAMLR